MNWSTSGSEWVCSDELLASNYSVTSAFEHDIIANQLLQSVIGVVYLGILLFGTVANFGVLTSLIRVIENKPSSYMYLMNVLLCNLLLCLLSMPIIGFYMLNGGTWWRRAHLCSLTTGVSTIAIATNNWFMCLTSRKYHGSVSISELLMVCPVVWTMAVLTSTPQFFVYGYVRRIESSVSPLHLCMPVLTTATGQSSCYTQFGYAIIVLMVQNMLPLIMFCTHLIRVYNHMCSHYKRTRHHMKSNHLQLLIDSAKTIHVDRELYIEWHFTLLAVAANLMYMTIAVWQIMQYIDIRSTRLHDLRHSISLLLNVIALTNVLCLPLKLYHIISTHSPPDRTDRLSLRVSSDIGPSLISNFATNTTNTFVHRETIRGRPLTRGVHGSVRIPNSHRCSPTVGGGTVLVEDVCPLKRVRSVRKTNSLHNSPYTSPSLASQRVEMTDMHAVMLRSTGRVVVQKTLPDLPVRAKQPISVSVLDYVVPQLAIH